MTKIQVFIDFEAISAPFSHKLNINFDLPYAYSIGIHVGKKFKTKTTIINFNNISVEGVFEFIRLDITEKVRHIVDNPNLKVGRDSIEFIGWAPNLEKKILSKSFRGVEVIDQLKGESLSLSTLTSQEFSSKKYFIELRKEVNKKIDHEFIKRRGLELDGALAAFAGYELFRSATNSKKEWDININVLTIIKEVIEYSKDDIERMSFLHRNPAIFSKRKNELIIKNKEKQVLSRKINKLNSFIHSLENLDKDMTIEIALKESLEKIKELKKIKDNL